MVNRAVFFKNVVLFLSLSCASLAWADAKTLPSQFSLKGLAGGSLAADDLKGKTVILQFWASWCTGCGSVMGELEPLVKESKGVQFVPVSVDESIVEARSYFDRQSALVKPLKKIAYFDADATLATKLGVTALPTVVVVDGKGKVLASIAGHPSKKQMQKIKNLIKN